MLESIYHEMIVIGKKVGLLYLKIQERKVSYSMGATGEGHETR